MSTESDIYSFGGYNPTISDSDPDLKQDIDWNETKPLFRELWKFSRTTRLWTKLSTCGSSPKELASHCAAIINNYLLVFGGTGVPFGETSSNKMHVLNLNSNALNWNLIITNNNNIDNKMPVEQYGQALTIDYETNNVYVVGGTTGYQYTIDVHMFDLKTHVWHHLFEKNYEFYGSFPQERYRHEIAFYNNRIYVIGGGTATYCHTLCRVCSFIITIISQNKSSINE